MGAIFLTRPLPIMEVDIKANWDMALGELTDKKVQLLLENINAIHEAERQKNIQHVIAVWKECGIQ